MGNVMSMSYKDKIRLIEGDCFHQNLKEDLVAKAFFKAGLVVTVAVFGFLYLSKM
jgi:hypothetical protein